MNPTASYYKDIIETFYRPEMCPPEAVSSISQSPLKPKRMIDFIKARGAQDAFLLNLDWEPFNKEDFLLAHSYAYVNNFFNEVGNYESNGLHWTPEFAESVKYTNSSLYHAIKNSIDHPEVISFSPTSGFHHATPYGGCGFCTFSGQAIAALKLFGDKLVRGAFIDLDGHFGNSIGDTAQYNPSVKQAIPYNINPMGRHVEYLHDLERQLTELKADLLDGKIQYVVMCHGADSHEKDQLGGQVTTEEWYEASRLVYNMIADVSAKLGRPIPLTIALFGGYRKDNYDAVLELHLGDLQIAYNTLTSNKLEVVKDAFIRIQVPKMSENLR